MLMPIDVHRGPPKQRLKLGDLRPCLALNLIGADRALVTARSKLELVVKTSVGIIDQRRASNQWFPLSETEVQPQCQALSSSQRLISRGVRSATQRHDDGASRHRASATRKT